MKSVYITADIKEKKKDDGMYKKKPILIKIKQYCIINLSSILLVLSKKSFIIQICSHKTLVFHGISDVDLYITTFMAN